ncbi:hypothetical protein ABEF93_002334 [Exophiala dermatitidis]
MRFFAALASFGLVALVAAQDATNTSSSSTGVASASSSPTLTAQAKCLQKCNAADICCQAACVNVPCPNDAQANRTTECAAKCPQGNGTQSETEQYASCQASCVSSYFLSTGTAAPTATGSSSSATATFGSTDATTTGGSKGSSASATGASASASATGSSGNGADALHVGKVGLGFLGLVIAGLAL